MRLLPPLPRPRPPSLSQLNHAPLSPRAGEGGEGARARIPANRCLGPWRAAAPAWRQWGHATRVLDAPGGRRSPDSGSRTQPRGRGGPSGRSRCRRARGAMRAAPWRAGARAAAQPPRRAALRRCTAGPLRRLPPAAGPAAPRAHPAAPPPPPPSAAAAAAMKNDEGEVVDLYIPRKWCGGWGGGGGRRGSAAGRGSSVNPLSLERQAAHGPGGRGAPPADVCGSGGAVGAEQGGRRLTPRPPPTPLPYPRSAWTNKLITAKDHASVQINVGHLDSDGIFNGAFTTYAFSGAVRQRVRCFEFLGAGDEIWGGGRGPRSWMRVEDGAWQQAGTSGCRRTRLTPRRRPNPPPPNSQSPSRARATRLSTSCGARSRLTLKRLAPWPPRGGPPARGRLLPVNTCH
jgi:hypothetical protein